MAELTWLAGELHDPVTGKTFKAGEPVTVNAGDADRLKAEFPGRFVENSEPADEADGEVELHSPLDVAEAKAEGTLIDDKGKKGGK